MCQCDVEPITEGESIHAINRANRTLSLRATGGTLRGAGDGTGPSEIDAHSLADPFFTTRREQGGTGMGLAIVSAILESCGASLGAKPNEAGAVLEISFRRPAASRVRCHGDAENGKSPAFRPDIMLDALHNSHNSPRLCPTYRFPVHTSFCINSKGTP